MLLVAVAIIMVNVLLIVFGPDARSVQTSYSFDSFAGRAADRRRHQGLCRRGAAIVVAAALFAFFRFTPLGKAIRACADNYTGALVVGLDVKRLYALTFGLGAACVGAAGCHAGAAGRRDAGARARLHAARLHHRHHRRARLDAGRAARRRADRRHRGAGRPALHAVGQEHVLLRPARAGAAVPAAGHPRQEAVHDRAGCSTAFRAAALCCWRLLLVGCWSPRRGSPTTICSPSSSSSSISPMSARPGTS